MKTILTLILIWLCGWLSGCASVQSQFENGHPNRKWVTVVERDGNLISTTDFRVRRTKSLFHPSLQDNGVILGSRVNPWLFGNIIYGGLPGVIVDALTGAAFEPYPLATLPAP